MTKPWKDRARRFLTFPAVRRYMGWANYEGWPDEGVEAVGRCFKNLHGSMYPGEGHLNWVGADRNGASFTSPDLTARGVVREFKTAAEAEEFLNGLTVEEVKKWDFVC